MITEDKFKASPLHDKRAIMEMLDKLNHEQMAKVVQYIMAVKNCHMPDVVEQSELPQLQKNVMNGLIDRAKAEQERKREDRQLIEQVANEKKLSEIILSTDEVKIYTVIGKGEWDVKYPFRSIYLGKKGTWENTNTVSPTFDSAFLVYLQYKHLGPNSQFVDFAMKMLEIPKASEE